MAILEEYLSQNVLDILRSEYKVFREVPLYNRSIDAVLIKNRVLYTIEFKVRDWRKAIKQIKTHMLIADFAYLCMPSKNFPVNLKKSLINYGIGLWAYDFDKKEILEILPPNHSFIQQSVLKEKVLQYLIQRGKSDGYT